MGLKTGMSWENGKFPFSFIFSTKFVGNAETAGGIGPKNVIIRAHHTAATHLAAGIPVDDGVFLFEVKNVKGAHVKARFVHALVANVLRNDF